MSKDALQERATETVDARERARYGRALGARERFNAVRRPQFTITWSYTPEEARLLASCQVYLRD